MPNLLEQLETKYQIGKIEVKGSLTDLEQKYRIAPSLGVGGSLEALESKYAIKPIKEYPGHEIYAKPPYVRVTPPKEITLKDELKKAGKETLKDIGYWASGSLPWNWFKEQGVVHNLLEWHDTVQDSLARFVADPSEYDEKGDPTLFPRVRAELLMGTLILEGSQGLGAIKKGFEVKAAQKKAMEGLVEKMGRVRTKSELAEFSEYLKSLRWKNEQRQLISTYRRLGRKFLEPVQEKIYQAKRIGLTMKQRRMEFRRLTLPEREMFLRGKMFPIYEPGEVATLREADVVKRIEQTVRRGVEIKTNLEKLSFQQKGKVYGLRVERPAYITQKEKLDLFPDNILVVENIPTAEGKVGAAIVNTEVPSVRLFKDAMALERELINISISHITTKTAVGELVKGHIRGRPETVDRERVEEEARYQAWLETRAKYVPPREKVPTKPEEVAPPTEVKPEVTPPEMTQQEALDDIRSIKKRIKIIDREIKNAELAKMEIDPKLPEEREWLYGRIRELEPAAYPTEPKELPIKAPIRKEAKPAKIETVIKTAQRVIGKKTTLPILANVLVKDGNLIATDLETALVVKTDKPDGLYKFIGNNLEKSELPTEDFPVLPYPNIDIGKISSREEFITNLERALRTVSTDETKYVLTGVLLKVEGGKGTIVSTDGRRLSVSDIRLENFKDGAYNIPPKKLLTALKGISGDSLIVKTDKEKNQISFQGDNGLVLTRLIEGKYPDYKGIMPKLNQQYIVNKVEIEQALKQLEPYAVEAEPRNPKIKIEQQKENLILTGGTKKMSIPVEVRDVSYTPTKGTIVMPLRAEERERLFNPDYLIDAIKNVKAEKVFIGLEKETTINPIHIYGEDLSRVKPAIKPEIKPAVPEVKPEVAPPKEIKLIPPELESLVGVARMYKSLDEFYKALDEAARLGTPQEKQFQKSEIDKVWKAGFRSLKDFYNLATKEVKPEIKPAPPREFKLPFKLILKKMPELGYTVEEIRGMKSGAEIRRIVANQIPAEEYRKTLPEVKPTPPEIMPNGGEEIEDWEAGGQQFPPSEEILRQQAYQKHIMQCLKSLAEMAPKDMATNKQRALAHILAQKKRLTTRQLHRLEKIITGLTTMGIYTPTGRLKKTYMTKQQAGKLISALHKFFVPAYKKPSIPRGELSAKDLQIIKTDLMRKPMRRVDVARIIKKARRVIRDPQFRPHFVNAYWEWANSLIETGVSPYLLSMDVWAPRVENRTGLPIYSGIYLPFEDASRGLKVATRKFWKEVEDVWGKQLRSPKEEDREIAFRVHKGLIEDKEYFAREDIAPLTNDEMEIVKKCREFYDKYFEEFDIGHYQDYYSPRIREAEGVRMAYSGRVPKELRFFAELERVGLLSPLIEDERILMRIYFYSGARKKYYQPVLKTANEIKTFLPPNTLDAVDRYISEKLGYGTKGQRVVEKTIDSIMKSLKIDLGPPRLLTSLYFTSVYGGALGFRLHPVVRNAFQTFLLGYPEYGRWLAIGLRKTFTTGGVSKWRNKGFLVDWGVPYGEEIDRGIEGKGSAVEKTINIYRKFVRVGMIPYGRWIDTMNRCNMANACEPRFNHYLKKYKDGKISLKKFESKINLDGEDKFIQQEVRNHILNKDYEKALDRLVGVGIDNTQWPYRAGAGPQVGYGGAKVWFTFWLWPHRYLETLLGKWLARKQWSKIWRWLLICYAMKKLGDKLGFKVRSWVHLGPLSMSLTPAMKVVWELAGILNATMWRNRREMDLHWKDMKRNAPVFVGYGIFGKNVKEFLEAADNDFIYFDERGRYKYQLTPVEALMRTGGFMPKSLEERHSITTKFYNQQYLMKKAKQDIKDMYLTGQRQKALKNYSKFLKSYYRVYLPVYWKFKAKYGKDYKLRTGKEVPKITPHIMPRMEGIREQE